MWSWRRRETVTAVEPAPSGSCPACCDGLEHCHGTLVLHADGALDCEGADCAADPDLHGWWVPCTELEAPCGCLGDEHPIGLVAKAA